MGVKFISKNYWAKRIARAQHKIADKSIDETNKQLKKYYETTMKNCIASFEATYDKYQATIKAGNEPSLSTLYNLDKYWQMQAQLREELQKLGEIEIALMSENFEDTWVDIYNSVALKSQPHYSSVDRDTAQQMINSVWCADGKTWSQRVWDNTDLLAQTLNDELINCVVTGKNTNDLKQMLMERFGVSYRQAETLVKTEIAHIQVQAAAEKYQQFGTDEYEYFADNDERTCPICGKLDGKKFKYSEMKAGKNAPPMHPRCRCDILPVLKDDKIVENKDIDKPKKPRKGYTICPKCGKEFKAKNGAVVCDKCENDILNSKGFGLPLRAKGFDEKAIVKHWVEDTDESWENVWKSQASLYEIWKKKNPEDSLENYGYHTGYSPYRNTTYWYRDSDNKMVWEDDLFFKCIDCGEVFKRTSNSQIRCPNCEAIHRKKYKALKEKERRLKKKLQNIGK